MDPQQQTQQSGDQGGDGEMRYVSMEQYKRMLTAAAEVEVWKRQNGSLPSQGSSSAGLGSSGSSGYSPDSVAYQQAYQAAVIRNHLAGVQTANPAASGQMAALLAERLETRIEDGKAIVCERRTGRPVGEVIREALGSEEFSHFLAPASTPSSGPGAQQEQPQQQLLMRNPEEQHLAEAYLHRLQLQSPVPGFGRNDSHDGRAALAAARAQAEAQAQAQMQAQAQLQNLEGVPGRNPFERFLAAPNVQLRGMWANQPVPGFGPQFAPPPKG